MGRGTSKVGGSGRKIDYEKSYSEYLSSMSNVERGRTNKALTAQHSFSGFDGINSERELIELSISKGYQVETDITIPKKISSLMYDNAPEQFKFAKREEGLRESDYGAFVRGTLDTPLTRYFRGKDKSALADTRFSKTEYRITGHGESSRVGMPISKTAAKYHEYLSKKKGNK